MLLNPQCTGKVAEKIMLLEGVETGIYKVFTKEALSAVIQFNGSIMLEILGLVPKTKANYFRINLFSSKTGITIEI